ncbi:1,2-phenylacetyl-CoA epoxidase subunit PaaC [Marinactinospora rubrisoli]|uniref:1,2-phenylacetyl-CoA epoxidase subunit PaaC n=1 Tax=Marinactinospora rubrisoli TaxID=2715399 RepID=A0ABW2KDV0_9ACTN
MSGDSAYDAIAQEHTGDARWAFGTGFTAPLAGLPAGTGTAVPPDVPAGDLAVYCLMLGDDALVLAQRLIEWCTDAPELEEEVALANIALDLLGQARLLLTRAGQADGTGRDEDALAYFRDPGEFRNVRLAEAGNGDFGRTIARLLVFATWRLAVFTRLAGSADPVLAAIAAKGVNELAYHRDYAAQWTLRLGLGTDESHRRLTAGLAALRPLLGELFAVHPVEDRLAGHGAAVRPEEVYGEVAAVLEQVRTAAGLDQPILGTSASAPPPPPPPSAADSGRDGAHGAELVALLAEMQSVAREHPEATW